jgi:hypothetical protein
MRRMLCALILVAFAAAPALADPKSDLMAAMLQFGKMTSYHITATDRGSTIEADMALPAKMHVTMGPVEMIKIDSTTWVKMNGSWRQFAFPGMEQLTSSITNAVGYASGKYGSGDMIVTDLGMKSPEGVPLHAYTVTDKAGRSPATLYLDSASKLVRVDTPDGGVVRFSKFDAIDPIVPPV